MQLEKALAQPGCAVFYFYSTQEFLVRDAAQKAVHHLMQGGDAELTRIEGPSPDIGEAVAAAGTISLFGTKRVVEMPRVEPAAMSEKDVEALCDLMQSLENAVMVLTTVFKDDKAKTTKKAKRPRRAQRWNLKSPGPGLCATFWPQGRRHWARALRPVQQTRWCSGAAQTCIHWKMNLQSWPLYAATPR